MIAIIDYGMGNIHSVQKALDSLGAQTLVTDKPAQIKKAAKVVLPGVGAFGDALVELKKQGLAQALSEHIKQGKIFLGICLGMHLLFEASHESPETKGLGILKGSVIKFNPSTTLRVNGERSRTINSCPGLKVPHIGWNQLKLTTHNSQLTTKCPLLKDILDNSYVYFCHSYYPEPRDKDIIAATTDYGKDFASVVWQDNIYGVQFHPEKSQDTGLRILNNFVNLC